VYNAESVLKKVALQALIELEVRPKPELLIRTTVHELLWNYTDPLLKVLHNIGQVDISYISLQLNNSYSDLHLPSMVHSGAMDSKKTAQFIEWATLKQMPYWKNKANFINTSTSGILWHSLIEKDEKLEAFISDVNRSVMYTYTDDSLYFVIGLFTYTIKKRCQFVVSMLIAFEWRTVISVLTQTITQITVHQWD